MNRRTFIRTGLAGLTGLAVMNPESAYAELAVTSGLKVDKVKLGKTGLKVSRIAMGTGTVGVNHSSNQTRLGMEKFTQLVHHAYEKGISCFDMADNYGSHSFVGQAIKGINRKKVTLMTKMWTHPDGTPQSKDADKTLARYLEETGADYFDILLMHCMMEGNWHETRKYYMEAFSKAKQTGLVKAVGVSCHNLEALKQAASNPWVDVILARINPFQTAMDGTPEAVSKILEEAQKNGKGVIGMKIFGEGKHVSDEERQRSISYVLTQGNIHGMTLGLESESQVDNAVERVMNSLKNK